MSTPATPTAVPPGRNRTRRSGVARSDAVAVTTLLLLIGTALMLAAGGVAIADGLLRDEEGYLMSSETSYSSPGYAIRSDSTEIDAGAGLVDLPARWLGRIKATADPLKPGDTFVGVALAADVDRYLTGVASSTVLDPFDDDARSPRLDFVDGGPPPGAPAEQDFWIASASGPGLQDITWDAEAGDWTLVVMNARSTAPVRADIAVGAEIPRLATVAPALVVSGLVVVVLSAAALLLIVKPRESGGAPHP